MFVPDPWLLVLCIACVLGALGAVSGAVNTHLWMSEPMVCVAAGVALGPVGFGLLRLDVGGDHDAAVVLREAARITLAVSVTAAGMRLPAGWMRRHWRGLAVALGPGLVAMCAVSTGAAWMLGVPWPVCFVLGAVLTPTDPVLSAPIVTGRLARDLVPADLRHAITAESAANDGLALLLVGLSVLLADREPAAATLGWAVHAVVWETGVAIVGGAVAGWLSGHALNWAERRSDQDPAPLLTSALTLALVVLAAMQMLGANGVLAAFIAGSVLNEAIRGEREQRQEHFNEGFSRFFDLPVLVLFGAAAPWGAWMALGWPGVVFLALILVFRRMPAWFVLGPLMPWTRGRPEMLFAGWFGPLGAAALFYACDIQATGGFGEVWPMASLVIFGSVLLHGVTGTPLTRALGWALAASASRREGLGGRGGGSGEAS